MYEDTTSKVITPDGETETFNILAGILQDDTLAPYHFVVIINYIMRTALIGREENGLYRRKKNRRISPINVIYIDFVLILH